MNQYSEIMGSFTRTGDYPLEANYIFDSEEALKEFYQDSLNATTLHAGLLKVVLDENQTLYWVVKDGESYRLEPLLKTVNEKISTLTTEVEQLQDDWYEES